MQHVGFFVCPNHRILDLAGPLGAFEEANILIERGGYRLTVVSESGGTVVGSSGVPIDTQSSLDTAFDTVLFIGGNIGPFQNPNTIAVAKDLVTRTGFVAEILERDSLFETSLLAVSDEQAEAHTLPNDELVLLQRSTEEA
ncbi:hypothetical protein GOB83_06895, partial [Acetobacter fabarum]|uniref:DJ-1/PfpI family protein n=2 Tax=Acetobacter fabarum TaxID=483199 RepID=UPI0016ADAE67